MVLLTLLVFIFLSLLGLLVFLFGQLVVVLDADHIACLRAHHRCTEFV